MIVGIHSVNLLISSALVYLLPILCLIIFALLGKVFFSETASILLGLSGLAFGFFAVNRTTANLAVCGRLEPVMSEERRASMKAYGAEIISVSAAEGIEGARDLALKMQENGEGLVLNQFANQDNPLAHYQSTGPEIWRDTDGEITHFVSAMGTTGTIMGTSRFLKEQNSDVQIVGVQPATDSDSIPGIRRWPAAYLPEIFEASRVDKTIDISQPEAEDTMNT